MYIGSKSTVGTWLEKKDRRALEKVCLDHNLSKSRFLQVLLKMALSDGDLMQRVLRGATNG